MSENLRKMLTRVTDELDALNCAFREHIDDCAEPEEEHERCDATDELLEQARAALAEPVPAPCPICDANEVVELRTKHCLKCDADFAGADEMSANKAAVLAARAKRIEPALAQTEQQPVGRVLTYEESLRSDGKSGPAFWFGPLPAGAFLYAAPVAQTATLKPHQLRELVNDLRDVARKYHATEQLREQIAHTLRNALSAGGRDE